MLKHAELIRARVDLNPYPRAPTLAPTRTTWMCVHRTWWVGTYGLAVGDASCEGGTGVLQFCEMGPFVGFRSSRDGGKTWKEPEGPGGQTLTVANPLFPEVGVPVKLGAPHVVSDTPVAMTGFTLGVHGLANRTVQPCTRSHAGRACLYLCYTSWVCVPPRCWGLRAGGAGIYMCRTCS